MNIVKINIGNAAIAFAVFLIIFSSFEELLYRLFGVSGLQYVIAKSFSEFICYVFLIIILLVRVKDGSLFRYKLNKFDIYILLFIFFAFLSTIINGGSIVGAVINLKTLIRYLSIYYVIVLSYGLYKDEYVIKMISVVVVVGFFQTFLVALQAYYGETFMEKYFYQQVAIVNISGVEVVKDIIEKKIGAVVGSFGKPAPMAYYMLIPISVISIKMLSAKKSYNIKYALIYVLFLMVVFMSYKRGAFVLGLMVPMIVSLQMKSVGIKYYYLLGALFALFLLLFTFDNAEMIMYQNAKDVFVTPVESISMMLNGEYWVKSIENSRGWFALNITSDIIENVRLLGYGADEDNARLVMSNENEQLSKLMHYNAFNDVYWVAMLSYYGPIGLSLFFLAIRYVYQNAKIITFSESLLYRNIGRVMCLMILVSVFAAFIERVYQFRSFAICFWAINGVIASKVYKIKQ